MRLHTNRLSPIWIAICLGVLLSGCAFPRDPESTTRRVEAEGVLLVGVTEDQPWVVRNSSAPGAVPSGVEAELVKQYAAELDVDVSWIWGASDDHMEALQRYELHLVIGGLTQATAWKRDVALSSPYFTEHIVVGAPPGMTPPADIDGTTVAVRRGTVYVAYVTEHGGIPMPVDDPFLTNELVAAPEWELAQRGYTVAPIALHQTHLVMAAPPGENRWLMQLERSLRQHSHGEIAGELAAASPPLFPKMTWCPDNHLPERNALQESAC